MRSIAKAIRISHAKFHCYRLTTAQEIQDYRESHFLAHIVGARSGVMSSRTTMATAETRLVAEHLDVTCLRET